MPSRFSDSASYCVIYMKAECHLENESRKDAIRVSTLKNDPCASLPRVYQSFFFAFVTVMSIVPRWFCYLFKLNPVVVMHWLVLVDPVLHRSNERRKSKIIAL